MLITTKAAKKLKNYDEHAYTKDLGDGNSIYNPRQSMEQNFHPLFEVVSGFIAAPVIELGALIPGFRGAKIARDEYRELFRSFQKNLSDYRMHKAAAEAGILPHGVELSDVRSLEDLGLQGKLP